MSISGPSTRFDALRVPELGAQVAEAARDITDLIGGQIPDHMRQTAIRDLPLDNNVA